MFWSVYSWFASTLRLIIFPQVGIVRLLVVPDKGSKWRRVHIFAVEAWLATHCHLPPGILTQVSVHLSGELIGLPSWSVPLPLNPPVAIAVLPNTETFRSVYSAVLYFDPLMAASASALPNTLPSLAVSVNPSANNGASRSGLLVCWAFNHCCSSAATAFSLPPAALFFCAEVGSAKSSRPAIHHASVLISCSCCDGNKKRADAGV